MILNAMKKITGLLKCMLENKYKICGKEKSSYKLKKNNGSRNSQFQVIRKLNKRERENVTQDLILSIGIWLDWKQRLKKKEKRWLGLSKEWCFRIGSSYYIMMEDYKDYKDVHLFSLMHRLTVHNNISNVNSNLKRINKIFLFHGESWSSLFRPLEGIAALWGRTIEFDIAYYCSNHQTADFAVSHHHSANWGKDVTCEMQRMETMHY